MYQGLGVFNFVRNFSVRFSMRELGRDTEKYLTRSSVHSPFEDFSTFWMTVNLNSKLFQCGVFHYRTQTSYLSKITRGSAIAEVPRDALLSGENLTCRLLHQCAKNHHSKVKTLAIGHCTKHTKFKIFSFTPSKDRMGPNKVTEMVT